MDQLGPDLYSPKIPQQDTLLLLGLEPGRSSLSQEVGDTEGPRPNPWKPPFHCFHSSTSPETIQEAQREADFAKSLPCLRRVWTGWWGCNLLETGSKARRREKGPDQSWLGSQQVGSQQEMGPLKVRG